MNPRALRPLLAPRSIAIVGASESPDSWAPEIYSSLQHLGYDGELIPINPKYDEVWGRPCLPSASALPKGVDLAVVVVPARVAVRSVDEAGAAGVRSAMVVSSGFAEAGEEGRALQDELTAVARKHRLPVLGPNVEGYVNYVDRVAPYGTTPPAEPVPGAISVISQSGTVAWTMNQMASDRGLGLRIILGVGNEAVLGLGDLYEWAAQDPETKVVTTYIETLRDVEGIGRGLEALRRARKPILVCAPAGRSEAARRSIVAHTGALAGNTGVRDAWLRSLGAVLVSDPVEMFETAVLLSHHRKLRRTGVSAALQSGGACTLFAEAAGEAGLELPSFAPATARALRKALPSFANLNNPLDVTGQAAVETPMFVAALDALAHDPSIGFIGFDAFPPRGENDAVWAEPVLARARELQRETGVVFASVAMSPLAYSSRAREFVRGAKLPFIQGHHAATGAIRALVELQSAGRRARADDAPGPARTKALRFLRGLHGPLDEARAAELLSLYGVKRPRETVVATPAQAAKAAERIGFPVAVKVAAAELPHKAKLGGVKLGLRTAADVETAAGEVLRAAKRAGAAKPQVLVQQMVSGTEVLVGAVIDERFGPAITIRPGGALAEAGEATFVAAPLTPKQAEAYVAEQASACGLDASRHDLRAVSRAVRAIAHAASDLRGRLASLEANPLVVLSDGAVAVDALAEARPPA
ncbi:MAG: acetate--CoA ligase family protein [Actinomycetota bacterium]|nr:acetate--CoA ligase family protein [Actinomycetota bacterium]